MSRESLTSGLRGFTISLAVVLLPFALIYLSSEMLAGLHAIPEEDWLKEFFQKSAISQAKLFSFILAVYWAFSGLFGKGLINAINLANYLLIASFILVLGVNATFIFPILPQFDSICDQLPYPGTYSIFELHKCPTSAITFQVLNGLFLFLLVSSAVVRIVQSRRKYHSKL